MRLRILRPLVALAVLSSGCGARTQPLDDLADGGLDADTPLIPPIATCQPAEAWTTIGRAAVIYGDAADSDGRVVDARWALEDGPTGTIVGPVPVNSLATRLTPDLTGDYLVELTVTDDDGLTATCSSVVHSVVGPPVALCPDDITDASVGRSYVLEGDGFDDVGIIAFRWDVTEAPAGSVARPTPPAQPVTVLAPDVQGSYVLTLTATDTDGLTGSCDVSIVASGPPVAICPDEATVPTRRAHTVDGAAEDDGAIVLWRWELVEAPPESTATPAPTGAEDTVLTPDRVGRYVLRLTVTDDTGLTDSCEAVVNATPTPPTAICPRTINTTPLTEVTLYGDAVDDGWIVSWSWGLVSTPPGSAAVDPEPPDAQVATFFPDVAGEYIIRLTVGDDDGNEASCDVTVRAVPGEGLRVELYWNPPDTSCDTHPGPGCDSTDVDLHLLHPDAPHWFGERSAASDCYYATCVGGMEWDTADPADNPRLDLDDVEGFGPENINIDEPVVGHAYTVGVHFYSDDGTGRLAQAYVRIYCGIIEVDPVYETGPVELVGASSSMENDFWRVATVTWDGFRCSVVPLADESGGPDIIVARQAQTSR